MNMDMEKTAKFFGDFRAIWLGVALMIAGAAWAGDLRWIQVAEGGKIAAQVELRILKQRKAELVIQKSYETDQQKIRLMQALITNIQTEIDSLSKKAN